MFTSEQDKDVLLDSQLNVIMMDIHENMLSYTDPG